MLDFETELNKLLSHEIEPLPGLEFAQTMEMAALGQELASLGKICWRISEKNKPMFPCRSKKFTICLKNGGKAAYRRG
jgi:hypothetical protein